MMQIKHKIGILVKIAQPVHSGLNITGTLGLINALIVYRAYSKAVECSLGVIIPPVVTDSFDDINAVGTTRLCRLFSVYTLI